jgi:hypothetical protein
MDERIQKLKTPEDCAKFAKNATRLGHPELALEAQRRSIELKAEKHNAQTNAEKEALQAVYAYELLLTEKNGRTTRANRTWQTIKKNGIIEAVNRIVTKNTVSMGYTLLKEKNMDDLLFEAVVLRYPEVFSQEAVRISKDRLQE